MFLPEHKLETDIIKLLTYFDLFDYPLTNLEIWQLLPVSCTYQASNQALSKLELEKLHGFYHLPQRQTVVTTRQQRYNISDRKFKKALGIAKLFSYLPWIKLVALANLIGQHNLKAQGDIDLFIITKTKRLWLTRQLLVGLLKILRLRPTPEKTTDTICLSFLMDDHDLNLENFLLQQAPDNRDRYFTYWLASLRPLFDRDNTYNQLLKNNLWLKNYLPNWQPGLISHKRYFNVNNQADNYWPWVNHLELWAKKFQHKIMAKEIKQKMNQNTNVIVNDHILKLHVIDRRQLFYEKYLDNLKNYA